MPAIGRPSEGGFAAAGSLASSTAERKSTTVVCTDGAPRGSAGLTHPRCPPTGVTAREDAQYADALRMRIGLFRLGVRLMLL
jgi:hypothetical protein